MLTGYLLFAIVIYKEFRMKKIVILWAMVFISFHAAFSDDNLNTNENIFFPWQLHNYYSNNVLIIYPFENNVIFIISLDDYSRYLTYTNPSFYDYIYLINEPLGYHIYYIYQMFEFLGDITRESRRWEQIESNRRYNILNPAEPPKNTNFWKQEK